MNAMNEHDFTHFNVHLPQLPASTHSPYLQSPSLYGDQIRMQTSPPSIIQLTHGQLDVDTTYSMYSFMEDDSGDDVLDTKPSYAKQILQNIEFDN
jgi:hypothetical protein